MGRRSVSVVRPPSDYPEFAEFLVRCGIDSISLNPDTVFKTTERILQVEKELGFPKKREGRGVIGCQLIKKSRNISGKVNEAQPGGFSKF